MKTLLVTLNAKYIHTNLAIRYLYTYTINEYDVDFIEFTIKDTFENIINEIMKHKPQMIGFSCYIWNIEFIKKIIPLIKERHSDIKILLGGPEVSYDARYFFETLPIDFIISGEGEYPFKKLLEALHTHKDFKNIPQLHYRHKDIIYANREEFVMDLDTLPSPYRLKQDTDSLANRIQYIESSRGCPYRCSYCLASLEKHVRYFNIDFIKDEIRYLMRQNAKTFKFLDRTFNLRKDYAIEMFQFIINEHQKHMVFQFEITGDLLDDEVIHYLNQNAPIGLFRFEIGIQSTNELTNQLILRKQDFNKLKRNILLIQLGNKIDLHLDLIAGLPKEDYHSFIRTFNDVFELRPHELQLGFLKMLRGTKIRTEASLYDYDFSPNAPYEMIKNRDISQEELQKIHLAEDILEKYYNSHRFLSSTSYIIETYYPNNNYYFFENFGVFYHKNYSSINYQLHDLFIRLLEFTKAHLRDDCHIESLLIYDFLKLNKTRPKIWFLHNVTKEEKREMFQKAHEILDYNLDFLHRYAFVHPINIHPLSYEKGNYFILKLFSSEDQRIFILKGKDQ